MSEQCNLCGSLTTRKANSTYGSCAKCYKAYQQALKQQSKANKTNRMTQKVNPWTGQPTMTMDEFKKLVFPRRQFSFM
jgi:hypothetical protein